MLTNRKASPVSKVKITCTHLLNVSDFVKPLESPVKSKIISATTFIANPWSLDTHVHFLLLKFLNFFIKSLCQHSSNMNHIFIKKNWSNTNHKITDFSDCLAPHVSSVNFEYFISFVQKATFVCSSSFNNTSNYDRFPFIPNSSSLSEKLHAFFLCIETIRPENHVPILNKVHKDTNK